MVKGMRPLYKAIRSQEMVLVRPFRDTEAALRPYLRYYQWSQIWGSQEEPTEAILPDLQQRAIEEAKGLEPISPAMLRTKFQCLPEKAPGVSGWSNRMLKQLSHGALLPLTQLLTEMERTGRSPGQWRVVKFAMLAKKADIERPIGLCDVVYKAWLCLSVSIHRLFQAELAKVNDQCRVTLLLDLSTFYETISHQRLEQTAYELEYPATLLNIAVQIYRGARVLTADSGHSPATYSSRGVVAGCPIAPSLSKLALRSPCAEVFRSGLVSNLDTWIDDISADMVAKAPDKVAAKSVKVFRMLQASLGQEQLTLSSSKSAFVCTDKDTQKRVQQLLRPGEPPVLGLVKDLGVDSAGARRKRVATSNARLQKAMGRSRKLGRLKVPVRKKRAQVASTGVFTVATFGHQGQGLAPKRMKVLRAVAGVHFGKFSFGSLDLIFDFSEVGPGDPMCKMVLEHWNMLAECVVRNLPSADVIRRTWAASWARLSNGKRRWGLAAGPIAAMQCYLMDLGFQAPDMTVWRRGDFVIKLIWGDPSTRTHDSDRLKMAMCKDRWHRVARLELSKALTGQYLLKQAAKRPLVASGLRVLCQGAIRRAGHGGDLLCPRCNAENTLRHVLHDCPRWAVFDLGPNPAESPECFQVCGLVPKQATVHPDVKPAQMATQYHGLFKSKPLPVSGVYFGTDASEGRTLD